MTNYIELIITITMLYIFIDSAWCEFSLRMRYYTDILTMEAYGLLQEVTLVVDLKPAGEIDT